MRGRRLGLSARWQSGQDRRRRRRTAPTARATLAHWFHPQFEPLERRYVLATVAGHFLFYDQSAFDGGVAGVSPLDDSAIPNKSAYVPNGSAALIDSLSNYTRGINGIMVDLSGTGDHAAITKDDFIFEVGTGGGPWTAAPDPSDFAVRLGDGVSGSDRVEITWASGSIVDTWLRVQVLPTEHTGLAATDVFFWGNLVGETAGVTPSGGFSRTFSADGNAIVANGVQSHVGINSDLDVDRSNSVSLSADRNPIVAGGVLTLPRINVELSPPALAAGLANDTAPDGETNNDGITSDPTVSGIVTTLHGLDSLVASLDGGPGSSDLTGAVQPAGEFTVGPSELDTINGGPLVDGAHVLHLRAEDVNGLIRLLDVPFTLKRSVGTPQLPDLVAGSDSGASATDNVTNDNTPTIEVTAESGSFVILVVDGTPVSQQLANPLAVFTLSGQSDGPHSVQAQAIDVAGNTSPLSAALSLTIDTVAPTVTASTLLTFTDDLTPHVTVDAAGEANDTQVRLDVDVNNDGDFNDAGETSRTLSTLYNGSSYFELNPALPETDPIDGPYLVQLRARVTDLAGNEGTSPLTSLKVDTLGSTALLDYVTAADPSYSLSTLPVSTIAGTGFTVYVFDLKSQTWRSASEVTTPVWQHWLQIIVPATVTKSTATLLITGGSIGGGAPMSLSGEMQEMGALAVAEQMITAILPTVPNEPLHFTDEAPGVNRSEDDIIAYSFDKFVNDVGPDVNTWPALLPMVKSAVKAMDAIQARDTSLPGGVNVDDFIVTGFSKRGWTTWLTGAVDNRVKAIVPGVIDLLNLDESMVHHYGFYDAFSEQIAPYQAFDLIQNVAEPANQDLGRIVDPYHYLNNSHLTNIPKLLLNSTGDEFFVPDSGQFYLHDIPGQVYVRYIPNTGHGLDDTAVGNSELTWADAMLNNRTLPQFSWTVEQDGSIHVQADTTPTQVLLWQATNDTQRDFRWGYTHIPWNSTVLSDQGGGLYIGSVDTPDSGATAFMIELTFPSSVPGVPYVFTTEVHVISALDYPLAPWPFFMPSNDPPGPQVAAPGAAATAGVSPTVVSDDHNALAFAIAAQAAVVDASSGAAASATGAVLPESVAAAALADEASVLDDDWSWLDEEAALTEAAGDLEALELALAGLDEESAL